MKRLPVLLIVMVFAMLLLPGCAGKRHDDKGIPSANQVSTYPRDAREMLYYNPDAPSKKYTKFMIEPVQIYQGEDHGFGDISMEERQMMADFTHSEMVRVIAEKYAIAEKPGPDTMKIKLTLVGLEKTNTVLRGLSYGNPIGLAMNLAKGALGKEGNFMGSVTLGGEFEDSQAGTVIAAFVGKIHPFALSPSFSPWDAARAGITKFATDFRDRVDEGGGISK